MAGTKDPMSLSNGLLVLLEQHEDAARDAGLHPHTLRGQVETSVAKYENAVRAGDAAAIEQAERTMILLAADVSMKLAHAAIRLLEQERGRDGRS